MLNARCARNSENEWQDWLADEMPDQETRLADREERGDRHEANTSALDTLSERERDIIQERRLKDEPATLEELSQKYGVSRERVRQIEVQPRLREAASRHAAAKQFGARRPN